MEPPSERHAVPRVLEMLAELVGEPALVRHQITTRAERRPDAVIEVGRFTFVVEWKGSGAAAPVAAAADQSLAYAREIGAGALPLVAVPFMGEVGRKRCEQAEVCWLDLSGNAYLVAPGLRVVVMGRPNRFKRRGRPANAFAPKSARIARWLLLHPHESMTQREIARATDMDEGFTSRIVAKLEGDGLVERDQGGGVRVPDPGLLLDAWEEVYGFSKHHIHRGHVPARSGDTLLRQLSGLFDRANIEYAATGLGAAWVLTHFATFRIVTLYLRREPSPEILEQASFREDPHGANVWLVLPNDEGVFHGSTERDGLRCVHPVQVYLDLEDHPERAKEAAKHLRAEFLNWRDDDRQAHHGGRVQRRAGGPGSGDVSLRGHEARRSDG
jgi:hypothetical protein